MKYKRLIEATEEVVNNQTNIREKLEQLKPILDVFTLDIDTIISKWSPSIDENGIEYMNLEPIKQLAANIESCGYTYSSDAHKLMFPEYLQKTKVHNQSSSDTNYYVANFIIHLTEQPYIELKLRLSYFENLGGEYRFHDPYPSSYMPEEYNKFVQLFNRVKLSNAFIALDSTMSAYPEYVADPSNVKFKAYAEKPTCTSRPVYKKQKESYNIDDNITYYKVDDQVGLRADVYHEQLLFEFYSWSEIDLNVKNLDDFNTFKQYTKERFDEILEISKKIKAKWDSSFASSIPAGYSDRIKLKDIIE